MVVLQGDKLLVGLHVTEYWMLIGRGRGVGYNRETTPDLFTMGPWHGEISSNVTFAYCTKWCMGVVVLRGRPLTHVRNLSMKPEPFYRAFSFFFLHENSQRGCIRA